MKDRRGFKAKTGNDGWGFRESAVRLNSRSKKLGLAPIGAVTMYNLVQDYLARQEGIITAEERLGQRSPPDRHRPGMTVAA